MTQWVLFLGSVIEDSLMKSTLLKNKQTRRTILYSFYQKKMATSLQLIRNNQAIIAAVLGAFWMFSLGLME
jgi:hypothetical protein